MILILQAHSKWALCKVFQRQKPTRKKMVVCVPSSPSKPKKRSSQAVIMAEPRVNDDHDDSYLGQEEHRSDRTPNSPSNVVENDHNSNYNWCLMKMEEQSYWDSNLLYPPPQVSAVESNPLDGHTFDELLELIDFER